MNKRLIFIGSAVAALAVAAGCGGGGSSTSPLPLSPSGNHTQAAQGTIKLTIPRASGSAATSKRSPQYIASNTQSFSVQVGTGTPVVTAVAAPACVGTPLTCTVPFTGIVGDNSVTIKTFSSVDGSGTALSQNTTTVTLAAGTNSPVSLTLNPVVATQVVTITSPNPATITADGTTQNAAMSYVLEDSTGATVMLAEGSLVDSNGNPLPAATPNAVASPVTGVTVQTYSGDAAGGSWPITVDTSLINASVKFTVAALSGTNIKATSATLTITATPAPTASVAPTATPTNAVSDGDFASGTLATTIPTSGWYICYANHGQTFAAPVAPDPATPTYTGPQTAATPPASVGTLSDASIQSVTPSGAAPPSGNTHFAMIGSSSAPTAVKGQVGICQDVTVPAGTSVTLTFNVYEGGNDNFVNSDTEADVYAAGSFVIGTGKNTSVPFATGTPTLTLFAESNCYDNLQNNAAVFSAASGWGTNTDPAAVGPTSGQRYSTCPYSPGGILTPTGAPSGGDISLCGYWYSRSFDLSTLANTPVTLFLGDWRHAGSAAGSWSTVHSTGTNGYYSYAYFDSVLLTGTPPI